MAYLSENQKKYLQTAKIPGCIKKAARRKFRSDLRKKIELFSKIAYDFVQDAALIEETAERIYPDIQKTKSHPIVTLTAYLEPHLEPAHCEILERIIKNRSAALHPDNDETYRQILSGLKAESQESLRAQGILDPIQWMERKTKARRILLEIESKTAVTKDALQDKLGESISIGRRLGQLKKYGLVVGETGKYHITNKGKLVASWFKHSGD